MTIYNIDKFYASEIDKLTKKKFMLGEIIT